MTVADTGTGQPLMDNSNILPSGPMSVAASVKVPVLFDAGRLRPLRYTKCHISAALTR